MLNFGKEKKKRGPSNRKGLGLCEKAIRKGGERGRTAVTGSGEKKKFAATRGIITTCGIYQKKKRKGEDILKPYQWDGQGRKS